MTILAMAGAMAPYTHLLYKALAATIDEPLHVLASTTREPARRWDLPAAEGYTVEILPGLRLHRSTISNHYFNPAVARRMRALAPRLVLLSDFSLTSLIAALTAKRLGIPIGARTDGTLSTDPGGHSLIRRIIRRIIIARSQFAMGPSLGSLQLFDFYGVPSDRLYLAPLTAGWLPAREAPPLERRPYDVLFCGGLDEEVKGARFFAGVIEAMARRRPGLTVRVAGDGPLRGELESRFRSANVAAQFDGFVQQAALEEVYGSAKIFMFPSRGDTWGVVVNEAVQCGTPTIASPHAAASLELVAPAQAGVVLPLRQAEWVAAALDLLEDPARWQSAHDHALATGPDKLLDTAVNAYLSVIEGYAR